MTEDEALVVEALTGGPEEFTPIVHRYQGAVFGVALARIRDFHEAEDITQSVFVDAFTQLERLQDAARLGAWLRTMAIHKSIDWLRQRRMTVDVEEIANDPAHAEPHESQKSNEPRERVMEAIGGLGKGQRETVTLYYLSGYTVAQVAAIQEAPVGTVKARLHHARKKLKRDMMEMVETMLQSEAPGEDLAQRVFEVLSQPPSQHVYDIQQALRHLGAENAMEGFARASEEPSAQTRHLAATFVGQFAGEHHEQAVELLTRGLRDANRHVRARTIRAALAEFSAPDELKRQSLIPLVVELLQDESRHVRETAARQLQDWPADVPLEKAARALLGEPNRQVRVAVEELLRVVLDHYAGEAPEAYPNQLDEQLARLIEMRNSPNAARRARGTQRMLGLPMTDEQKRRDIVPLVVAMLRDRARRVRHRAAFELWAWAADVPVEEVQAACRAESHDRTLKVMNQLLERVKQYN